MTVDYVPSLNDHQIAEIQLCARLAADQMIERRHAYVDLQPGDGTRYEIVIVHPLMQMSWAVAFLNLSQRANWWHPSNSDFTDPAYCARWSEHTWTQQVLSVFLNTLRDEWRAIQ